MEDEATRLERHVESVPFWFHSIDFGHGVVSPGAKSPEYLAWEVESLQLPPLEGRSVLDVGTWDGFYAFEAERRRASRVVALDHFVWAWDMAEALRWRRRCEAAGQPMPPVETIPELWRPEELPGKRGFDTARALLGSGVEAVAADFMTADLDALGQFDVVLFLGVLYHMRHPLLALERLARLTAGVAVIETHAGFFPGGEDLALCRFLEGDELDGDPTNWWSPNLRAVESMCRAAGFSRVEVVRGPRTTWRRRPWGHRPPATGPCSTPTRPEPAVPGPPCPG
ncbi:MAG TPA: DUF1698 domain-containing protein [Acidimicrobiales bacterium]|nr:DUF1698 domain-containing protein [Acidimicrobiales bacterium]